MKRYLTIVNILLVAGILYFGYQLYETSTRPPTPVTVVSAPKPMTPMKDVEKQPAASTTAIIRRNLFNTKMNAESIPAKVDIEHLEQTSLNLKLWGTATGTSEQAYAIIEEKGKRTQTLYREGDAIQNARVKLILREKVVLNVDGKDEVLEIEKLDARTPSTRSLNNRAPVVPPPSAPAESLPAPSQTPAEESIEVNREEFDSAMQNTDELLNQVRIRPHFTGGKQDGLSLSGIRPNSIFRKMGLRNGDVITTINGEEISNMEDVLTSFQGFSSSDDSKINILRRGRERVFNYSVK